MSAFHVIKENDLFLLTQPDGDIAQPSENAFGYGLFTRDTRMLSKLSLQVNPDVFVLLSADVSRNFEAEYQYTNKERWHGSELIIPRECILMTRKQLVNGHGYYEQLIFKNYSSQSIELEVCYTAAADFMDMFEVRGYQKGQLVGKTTSKVMPSGVRFTHVACDGLCDVTDIHAASSTGAVNVAMEGDDVVLKIEVTVPARDTQQMMLVTTVHAGMAEDHIPSFHDYSQNVFAQFSNAHEGVSKHYAEFLSSAPNVSGDASFKSWYERGLLDLRMLMTDFGTGSFPVAGVPWYAVPFGRDSIIASLQMLIANPDITRGTLLTLAAHQGERVDPARDEQPGKIMHELRAGELTRTGEVPFGPYYGTIDATPLFLNLASEYFAWTNDLHTIKEILPNIIRAFDWIEQFGDRDGDGFVEYYQEASKGIANQGWKDSGDSVVHKDGRLAVAPIALCEVQGYVYRAYTKWASIFALLGDQAQVDRLQAKASHLQQVFIKSFWIEEDDAIALALDAEKSTVGSVSSNMGQVLWSGILPHSIADRVIDRLLRNDMFNGWGIRTLSSQELAYNPLSYHNGSVWPHDTSMVLAGMQHYGRTDAVSKVAGGLLKAAKKFELLRLPELFSGYGSDEVESPIPYPVSCSPQAWAAATPVFALQAILGLDPEVAKGQLSLNPVLPNGVDQLVVEGIRMGGGELSVFLMRDGDRTACSIRRNSTGMDIIFKTI